ncbi:hypothetical protein AAAC51_06550 [Priestia megaterium]
MSRLEKYSRQNKKVEALHHDINERNAARNIAMGFLLLSLTFTVPCIIRILEFLTSPMKHLDYPYFVFPVVSGLIYVTYRRITKQHKN